MSLSTDNVLSGHILSGCHMIPSFGFKPTPTVVTAESSNAKVINYSDTQAYRRSKVKHFLNFKVVQVGVKIFHHISNKVTQGLEVS